MKMTFIISAVIATVLASFVSVSAKPCKLKPEKAPVLFGFKLGMTQAAAEKLSGQKAEENNLNFFLSDGKYARVPTGNTYFIIFNEKQTSKVLDNTVNKMSVSFMDDKLFEISMELNKRSPWVTAPDTAAFFQKKFGIPADAWVQDPEEGGYYSFLKNATCSGVSFSVSAGKSSMKFKMYETAVRARVESAGDEIRKKYADK